MRPKSDADVDYGISPFLYDALRPLLLLLESDPRTFVETSYARKRRIIVSLFGSLRRSFQSRSGPDRSRGGGPMGTGRSPPPAMSSAQESPGSRRPQTCGPAPFSSRRR